MRRKQRRSEVCGGEDTGAQESRAHWTNTQRRKNRGYRHRDHGGAEEPDHLGVGDLRLPPDEQGKHQIHRYQADLLDADSRSKLEQRLAVYPAIGYPLIFTSTRSADGLKDLHEHLKGHISILVGQSGVGKSSLVQALLPDLDIRTGSLSQVTGLGRHTTTVAMLYHVPGGGDLIDSPGVRDFTLSKVAPELLEKGFPEFAPYLGQCRFHNCRHLVEPGCAVHNAARDGAISPLRLENYRELVKAMSR